MHSGKLFLQQIVNEVRLAVTSKKDCWECKSLIESRLNIAKTLCRLVRDEKHCTT